MDKASSPLNVISRSPEETFYIGTIIGERLHGGDIVALIGDLGAGKTCLTKGIATGLGVSAQNHVTSPTFTLINEYQGRHKLYHFDLYRLTGLHDMEDMGFEEYLFGEGVTVIEWAEKIMGVLSDETIFISFTYLGENQRCMLISGTGESWLQISDALKDGGF